MTMCDGDDPAVATITGSTCDIRQRTGHQPRLIDLAALHVEGHHALLSPNRHGLNMACGGKDRQNGLFRRLYWLETTVRQISLRTAFVD